MTSTDDLRDKIREAVLRAECERPQKCPDCITDSVRSVVAVDVERSARAARECARNTDTAAEMIRAALTTARDHGPDAAIRALYEQAAGVDHLLDGLNLFAPGHSCDNCDGIDPATCLFAADPAPSA